MSGIWTLLNSHRDDFWLNVLAGVPFLFFDLVIITMLLPKTIQWWDERRWLQTRIVALNEILEAYRRFTVHMSEPVIELAKRIAVNPQKRGLWAQELTELASLLKAQHVQEIANTERQLHTALSILGPKFTKELLEFHYIWAKWALFDQRYLYEAIQRGLRRRGGRSSGRSLLPPLAGYEAYFYHSVEIHFRLRCLGLTYMQNANTSINLAKDFELDDNNLWSSWDIVLMMAEEKLSPALNDYFEGIAEQRRAKLKSLAVDVVLRPLALQTLKRRIQRQNTIRFHLWEQPNWKDHYMMLPVATADSNAASP